MDFTLAKYKEIIKAAQASLYKIITVRELLYDNLSEPFIVLRHDVDRRPANALKMAEMEAELGIRSSYYFRAVPVSFKPYIIKQIKNLDHEIGYHYEDWYLAKYDKDLAIRLFEQNLARLREFADIKTICMHGSPLARDNNMRIWEYWSFEDYGLKDCILSQDYSGYSFFTDSGRTFGVSNANLRDELGSADIYSQVKSSDDLIDFINKRSANKIMISTHPERWSDNPLLWLSQFGKDLAINQIKRGLKFIRPDIQSNM